MTPSDPTVNRLPDGESRTLELRPGGKTASTDFTVAASLPKTLGDFELLAEVGRGGMGRVYKARQRNPDRIVALKTILTRGHARQTLLERFKKEAEAAAQLDHPGIVPIYEFKEIAGTHFYTMAFVDGRSLDDRLERGPLDNRMAAFVTEKVAEAVAYAHAKGVIHRDLKPGNVLLGRDGTVKVTDFGLARRLAVETGDEIAPETAIPASAAKDSGRLTLAGSVMGTPGYISPEQATDSRQAGPAADVWAVGAILYSCLTGKPPFVAEGAAETLVLVLHSQPPPPHALNPACDPDLESICLKCLQKDPAQRYGSARELADDLKRWLDGQPIRSKRLTQATRLRRFLDASPELIAIAAGLIVHRLSNIQEGLFTGCAVFGISLAARGTTTRKPIVILIGCAVAFLTLMLFGPSIREAWIRPFAYLTSAAGALALIMTIGFGTMAIDPPHAGRCGPSRIVYWTSAIGVVGLLAAWTVAMAADGLHLAIANGEPSPIYTMTWAPAAQFFFILLAIAVIFGLAVACMLGVARIADLLSRRASVDRRVVMLIGGAAVIVMVIWLAVAFQVRWGDMFDAQRRLRTEPGSPWFEAVMGLDRNLGRIASWFFAVGLGLTIGASIGSSAWGSIRQNQPSVRSPSVLPIVIGAALGAVFVQMIFGQICSAEPAETARFAFWGPGPALSLAEDWVGYELRLGGEHSGSELLGVAALGIYWLKILLLLTPIAMGAMLGGLTQRFVGSRAVR